MKAAQYNKYGDPEVIEINVVSEPKVASGLILVEVYAASINPFDGKLRSGMYKDMMPMKFPVTIGGDFSGLVKDVGEGVTDYKAGDEVFGQAGVVNGGSGSFAQFVIAKVDKIFTKPQKISHIEAASLPLAATSAIQALIDHINLKAGQKILIHGGAGGIGSLAVQITKSMAAYVATTVGSGDVEFVKGMGADVVIDYKREKFEEKLTNFDAVFDTAGGETTDNSFKVLKKGGIIVSMVGAPSKELAEKAGVTAIGQSTNSRPEHFEKLVGLLNSSKIKPVVDKVFRLDQVQEAFDYQEQGHPRGKVVVRVKD